MIVFPNCKINLGLNILRKRSDGYHDIETIFYPVGISDILETAPLIPGSSASNYLFTSTGISFPGKPEDNLCVKAYRLLKKDFPSLPGLRIHLHKIIPAGAGLGGGSADAAFMLRLLDKFFKLDITERQLSAYALKLGSDCPFFLLNKPCFAQGTGDILEEVQLTLAGYKILLIVSNIFVETKRAFMHVHPANPTQSIRQIIAEPVTSWKNLLHNDFEESVFREHKEIAELKSYLYRKGALYASMSGSGSAVFGIFKVSQKLSYKFPGEFFVREILCK